MNGLTQKTPVEDRFFARVDRSGDCWLWTGPLSGRRYATIMADGAEVMAHRWSYEHFVGPIPEGLQIDHSCGVTKCVRPEHLRPVTPRQNIHAHWREQRGECRNGHPWSDETLVWRLGGKVRMCRICERAKQARYRASKKVARA